MPRSRESSSYRIDSDTWKEELAKFKAENPEGYRKFKKIGLDNWRAKHREHYLAKQREYQRAYRARKRTGVKQR